MELKISSPRPGVSASDCNSDPEEKEISDDDDDDRNHKHRRRDTQSQSLEGDASEQVSTRPFRKRNKTFENGHPYRGPDSQFEKKRPVLASFPRAPLDSTTLRSRMNQSLSNVPGPGRGHGRESSTWTQRDFRFNSVDIASQMVQHGSIPPSLFGGSVVPGVSNSQTASWSAWGLVPGIRNGGLDALHPLGLQGALRPPPINPSLNIGVPRQRCRDFEERGFCLRGDMCPMEHGINRIVVDDVQSLSQFNLPVSLPGTHLLGTTAGPGVLPAINDSSGTLASGKNGPSKASRLGVGDDSFGVNNTLVGSADLYDPDQPLWNKDCPETSSTPLALNSSNVGENELLLDALDHHHAGFFIGPDNERMFRGAGTTLGSNSANFSLWGKLDSSKGRSDMKEKLDSVIGLSNYIENEAKEDLESLNAAQGVSRQGKRINADDNGPHFMGPSLKLSSETGRNIRKPSQKALRTLFVNGIPHKDNKREALLSHFKKFGEVIDIHIPLNGERAFVQFSKREEAEAALQAPDAVMGNRFIKLWWANRDSITDDGISGGNNATLTPHGVAVASVSPWQPVANRGKDNQQSAAPKGNVASASLIPAPAPTSASAPTSDQPKPVVSNGPNGQPPLQKKLESLELLKEELRKKQEMLAQKRNDFRRQLDKLEKQASGVKCEAASEQAAKKQKVGTIVDDAKAATPRSSGPGTFESSLQTEGMTEKSKSTSATHVPIPNLSVAPQEPSGLKQSIRPLAPIGAPFVVNRYKLDNRPTAFKVIPPLPIGLADVDVLKEHFSMYGDLSTVELEVESEDGLNNSESSKTSALICFTTRRSAERAFLNGKCWQGHNMQFMWLPTANSAKEVGSRENTSKTPSDANIQLAGEEESRGSQDQEAASLGNGGSEDSEKRESIEEPVETEEELQSAYTAISCEKQLT